MTLLNINWQTGYSCLPWKTFMSTVVFCRHFVLARRKPNATDRRSDGQTRNAAIAGEYLKYKYPEYHFNTLFNHVVL